MKHLPWIKIIAALEVIGGASGILTAASQFLPAVVTDSTIYVTPLVVGAVYALSLYAGVRLWQGRASGRTASLIVQAIQLPKIFSPALTLMFSFGFDLWVYGDVLPSGLGEFGWQFRILAAWGLGLGQSNVPVGFGISLVAIPFLILLWRYRPEARPSRPAMAEAPAD